MNLISRDAGLAGIQIIPDEVRPISGYYTPALLASLADRYKFSKRPTIEEVRTKGAVFEDGRYVDEKRQINIALLGIFNNALSVTTTHTTESDFVLTDLFAWLQKTFNFRRPLTEPRKIFQSDLVVEFENDPADRFPALAPFMLILQEGMRAASPVRFAHIAFGADSNGAADPVFLIERRAGMPWSSKRYFCKAHLQTDAHILALEYLDKLMAQVKG